MVEHVFFWVMFSIGIFYFINGIRLSMALKNEIKLSEYSVFDIWLSVQKKVFGHGECTFEIGGQKAISIYKKMKNHIYACTISMFIFGILNFILK